MQITDNALPTVDHKKIFQYFTSEAPTWNFMSNVTFGYNHSKYEPTSWGFACSVFRCGEEPDSREALQILRPIIFDREKLIRIRVGFIVNAGPNKPHSPHIDQPWCDHWTQLYYLTASDAVTNVFEEYGVDEKYSDYRPEDFNVKSQCKPEPNRMCIFDGMHWHSSSPVRGNEARLVVSANYAK